jgi:dipeptidyl aminopeptidase/acylaminoacyl peptidase
MSLFLVNYTGSIGFGNRSISALEGNIGVRDVEDCFVN